MRHILKKFKSWLRKNAWIIVTSIVVLAIITLLLLYGSCINDKVTNIIMAFGAMLSAFFMFLAFKETRKSNEIKLKEDEFQDLKKKVSDLEINANETLYNEQAIKELCSIIDYSESEIYKITYSNFIYPFHGLFSHLFNHIKYKKCIELFSGTNRYRLKNAENNDDIIKLAKIFTTINKAVTLLTLYYFRLYFLYADIDTSLILDEQKRYLFNKLNRITDEFRYFFVDEIDKSDISFNTNKFDSTKFLEEFEAFEIDETKGIAKKRYLSFHSVSLLVNYLKFRTKFA